jgi:hypothetical protein
MNITGILKDAKNLAEQEFIAANEKGLDKKEENRRAYTLLARIFGLAASTALGTGLTVWNVVGQINGEFNAQIDKTRITISEQNGWNYTELASGKSISANEILAFNKSAQLKSFVQGEIKKHQTNITVHDAAVATDVARELKSERKSDGGSPGFFTGAFTAISVIIAGIKYSVVIAPTHIPKAIRRRYDNTPEADMA